MPIKDLSTWRGAILDRILDIRRVIDASTRAGVVIYSLQTPGMNTSPARSASENPFPDPTTLNVKFTIERQSEEAALEAGLVTFAPVAYPMAPLVRSG